VAGAVEACRERGADAAQVFVSNPRGWTGPRIDEDAAGAFRAGWAATGFGPLVAHAPYLVNIASPNREFLAKSRGLAASTARAGELLGMDHLIVHAGAGGPAEPAAALDRAVTTLRLVAAEVERIGILVELMAGTAGAVASTVDEAARLLEAVDEPRIGLCLDTCHLFAAGYEVDRATGVDALFAELELAGLSDRVGLIHANDSMFPRGERRDRHENVGDGLIGLEGWRALVGRADAAGLAMILETPGDAERQARDIALLRSLAS
jgi:deoxyribonuclease-4